MCPALQRRRLGILGPRHAKIRGKKTDKTRATKRDKKNHAERHKARTVADGRMVIASRSGLPLPPRSRKSPNARRNSVRRIPRNLARTTATPRTFPPSCCGR